MSTQKVKWRRFYLCSSMFGNSHVESYGTGSEEPQRHAFDNVYDAACDFMTKIGPDNVVSVSEDVDGRGLTIFHRVIERGAPGSDDQAN